MSKKLLFLDTETTGIGEKDRVLQVAYKIEDRTENHLFKPPVSIDKVAMSIHHVTEKMVKGKPVFIDSPTYYDLKELSEDKDVIFVAHNAKFDLGMLAREGITFDQYICTYKLAFWLEDEGMANHQLQYLRYYYDLEVDTGDLAAHDALADIIVLEAVFHQLLGAGMQIHDGDMIEKALDISSKPLLYRKFLFGKHDYRRTGMTIEDIVLKLPHNEGRGYLQWLLEQKMSEPADQRDENWIYTLNHYLKL